MADGFGSAPDQTTAQQTYEIQETTTPGNFYLLLDFDSPAEFQYFLHKLGIEMQMYQSLRASAAEYAFHRLQDIAGIDEDARAESLYAETSDNFEKIWKTLPDESRNGSLPPVERRLSEREAEDLHVETCRAFLVEILSCIEEHPPQGGLLVLKKKLAREIENGNEDLLEEGYGRIFDALTRFYHTDYANLSIRRRLAICEDIWRTELEREGIHADGFFQRCYAHLAQDVFTLAPLELKQAIIRRLHDAFTRDTNPLVLPTTPVPNTVRYFITLDQLEAMAGNIAQDDDHTEDIEGEGLYAAVPVDRTDNMIAQIVVLDIPAIIDLSHGGEIVTNLDTRQALLQLSPVIPGWGPSRSQAQDFANRFMREHTA